jgi:hypothetical protein
MCRDCREEKTLDKFSGRGGGRKGWMSYCKSCADVRNRRWVQQNPERTALRYRKSWLKRYNLTPADYDDMLAAQGGVCAICKAGKPGGTGRFHIDHDHSCCPEKMRSCGKCIRGLLCSYCNLHLAGEDPVRLRAGADYIENFRKSGEPVRARPGKSTRRMPGLARKRLTGSELQPSLFEVG